MKMIYRCLSCFNHFVEYVSSVNLKENKRNLEIPRISYSCCLLDCRTIELSDYRAVGQAIESCLETSGKWSFCVFPEYRHKPYTMYNCVQSPLHNDVHVEQQEA